VVLERLRKAKFKEVVPAVTLFSVVARIEEFLFE